MCRAGTYHRQWQSYLDNAWWISRIAGLAIAFVVIAIGLAGDWARKHLSRAGWGMV
jgi:ABC-type dipeptide/oligopeptide/nickel transport system permease subunit